MNRKQPVMRLLLVSDTVDSDLVVRGHSYHNRVDAIIACGDLPPEYLIRLRNLYDAPLYYVLGNHDIRHQQTPPVGCIPLDRRMMRLGPYRIVGFSGCRWYNGGVYQYTEKEMRHAVKKMRLSFWYRGKPDIVVTHAPPRLLGDQEDLPHRGFRVFRWLVDRYSPRYFLHGHIHRHFSDDSERVIVHKETTIVNCFGSYVLEI